jgi:DNA-binding beta-propeller fold protein YncE
MTSALDRMQLGLTQAYQRGMERTVLALGATDGTGTTAVAPYDFHAYLDRYGTLPDSPRYLVVPRTPLAEPATVRVWYKPDTALPEQSIDVGFPAGWPAGNGAAVPFGGPAASIGNTLRLTRFQPQPPADQHATAWQLVALLGNLAKLLWVAGGEHEQIEVQLADVAAQRNAPSTHGASLDLLGRDLSVPRFPPRPHTWDPATIALYHLDDRPVPPQPEVVTVADDRARYQATSHPGTNTGARSGRPGRFATAFEFAAGAPGVITIANHPDFALPAGASFTVEAVVAPDRTAAGPGAVLAKRATLNKATDPGWALSMGSYRGIDHNLRFSLGDGTTEIELFADRNLADGTFHHIAGVVEHRAGPPALTTALLWVDGAVVASLPLSGLGALSSPEPLRIGRGQESMSGVPTDAPFAGRIDEVRLSSVARSSFHPVTGEGDDQYRRRLQVFQRWLVPTPDALRDALSEMAGPVAGNPHPFVVDEGVDPLVIGTHPVRVLPAALPSGKAISADGDPRATEDGAVGVAADELNFDPAWLGRHPDLPKLDFGGVENRRRMQWSVRAALDRLLDRIAGVSGSLGVLSGYDPTASDLSGLGRVLQLSHDTLDPGDLAVHAFAAGFGFVRRTAQGTVLVAQGRADPFRVLPPPTGIDDQPLDLAPSPDLVQRPDLAEGGDLVLTLDPDLTGYADAEVHWSVARGGPGNATLTATGKQASLHALAAGEVSVHAEVTRSRRTAGGSRTVRIGLTDTGLTAGGSIGRDGTRGVAEAAAAGPATDDFDETYLVTRIDDYLGQHSNVDYGADPAHRRMQRVTGQALDRLLDLLTGTPGTVTVVRAYDAAGPGLLAQGRALWLRHSTLTGAALAARAFAAGFEYVALDAGPPPTVRVAVAAGEQLGIVGPDEVAVGQQVSLSVQPQADPSAVALSDDGTRGYVCDRASARVTALGLTASAPGQFATLTLNGSARVLATPVAVALAGGRLFVAQDLPGVVSVLDPVTLAAVATPIATGKRPVALATAGTRLFVGCAGDRTLRAYDATTGAPLGSAVLPDVPLALAMVPGGATLYAVLAGDRFCQIKVAGLAVGAPVASGAGAGYAFVTPDGSKLYISCAADDPGHGTGTVRVYKTGADTLLGVISGFPAGTAPAALAGDANQRYLYITTGRGVAIIDMTTDTLLPQVFTPAGPIRWLATSPAGSIPAPSVLTVSATAVTLGDPAPLGLAPPRPPRLAASVGLGSGAGEHIWWASVPTGLGRVELSSLVSPEVRVAGDRPGTALVRVVSVRGDHLLPYQFEVRLAPSLDADPSVTLSKDQYDLVMNLLNWFHPVGVEVRTDRLRAHVVELGTSVADLVPGYTFPAFRSPGLPAPGPTQG